MARPINKAKEGEEHFREYLIKKQSNENKVFNLTAIERTLDLPKKTLDNFVKNRSLIPTAYFTKVIEYFSTLGYDKHN